jgi:hypothetical protein
MSIIFITFKWKTEVSIFCPILHQGKTVLLPGIDWKNINPIIGIVIATDNEMSLIFHIAT